jgi:trk system potassium uptake protein TrkH
MLPCATKSGDGTSFIDALFTATSSVCVTGLIVHDTATYWSQFGQIVIILLIQIGGMGVITMAITLNMMSGKKIGLRQRTLMQEAVSAPKMGGIIRFTGFIVKTIFVIEIIGAVLMYPTFYKEVGAIKGIWYSLFHSVSAFCNAGFDLMGVKGKFSSLTSLSGSVVINIIIMLLIIIGGIGFMTWKDIKINKLHFKKYSVQTKIILVMAVILIVLPTLYFYCLEMPRKVWNGMSASNKMLASFFQAVSPRTAGFNTIDLKSMSDVSIFIMIILMLIGASPGSTAGGMKTTTVAVLFATSIATFKKKQDAHIFGRRIPIEVVRNAATILLMYVFLFSFGAIIISVADELPLMDTLFETASAVGTVGLTLGITPSLSIVSKVVLIILMFFGRVGGLTIIFATLSGKNTNLYRLPEEKIMVG